MATTAFLYGKIYLSAFNKEIDLDTDDIRAALVTSSYTPNQDTHQYWSSVVANEMSATGYTANGVALTSLAVSYTAGTNTFAFDCADFSWATVTAATFRYIVFYDRTPATDATRPLIGYVDFGADQSQGTGTGSISVTVAAAGVFTATVA